MPDPTPAGRSVALPPMQRIAAQHLARSLRESVPVTLHGQADAEALLALRARLAAPGQGEPRIGLTHLIVRAAALALRRHEGLNASLAGNELRLHADIHVGIAQALADGQLIVPVLRHADRGTLAELAAQARALGARAAAGKLDLHDVQGATFTVSNGGVVPSVRWTTPIIPLGQAAILGVGALHQAVVAHAGAAVVRWVLPTSLSFDHRFVNGVPAARFLDDLHRLIEAPQPLVA